MLSFEVRDAIMECVLLVDIFFEASLEFLFFILELLKVFIEEFIVLFECLFFFVDSIDSRVELFFFLL